MNKRKQAGLIVAMMLLIANSFGQSKDSSSEKIGDGKKSGETYFDLMVTIR